ncbi:MAG: GDP-mannose 4,6-dehydratase [Anaerolineales bacterium]|nr:GDP-mannose 4,6-dehydratase [Anaerolineales bacterium]
MAHYLLTGAAGFIASSVADLLLCEGHTVAGWDNLNDAYDPRLKDWRLERLRKREGFEFTHVDIRDLEAVRKAWGTQRFDAVINLAARAGVRQSVVDPWVYAKTNFLGVINLLETCVQREVPKFVQASTSSLYGASNPRPFSEETDSSRPLSPYAASKGAAEMMCHSYSHLHNLDITILRYFTVYGPAGRPDMSIFRFIQWIAEERPLILYGDGEQERDFTFVQDIARGTVAAVRPLGFELINLGSDQPYTMMDVIRRIEILLDKKAILDRRPTAPADVRATWANIEKAGKLLDWEPHTSLDDGLEACVRWYLEERDWAQDIVTSD